MTNLKTEELLQYYGQLSEDFRMRHTAIWTEVKHYSWVLSLLLGAGPAISMGKDHPLPLLELCVIATLPLIGLVISITTFITIKKDFTYFSIADARILFVEKELGLTTIPNFSDNRYRKANDPSFSIEKYCAEENGSFFSACKKFKIRGMILANFVVYGIACTAEIAYYIYKIFSA